MQNTEAAPCGTSVPLGTTHLSPPSRTEEAKPAPNPYLRLMVVAGILLPVAMVPYLLCRRRISGLQYQCKELEWKLAVLERRLSFNVSETSSIRIEQEKMRATLRDVTQETDELQHVVKKRTEEHGKSNQMLQSKLYKLLEETKQIRTQLAILQLLGVSLADIAAFMHEMELLLGLQGGANNNSRGIQRLRLLALQMQNLAQKEEKENKI